MRNDKNKNSQRRDSFSKKNNSINEILPSSEILERFEDAVPGSVDQLIKMAEKEQNRRHLWQENYLKSHNINTRLGQFCSLAYNTMLLGVIYKLINAGKEDLALKIFFINTALIAFTVIFTTFERRVFSRRPRMRHNHHDRKKPHNKERN